MATPVRQAIIISASALLAWSPIAPAHAAAPAASQPEDEPVDAAEPDDAEPATEPAPAPEPEPEPEPEPAAAGEVTARLAILPLAIDGAVDEGADERLLSNLRKGFSRGAFGLVDQGTIAGLGGASCDAACIAALKSRESADFVLKTSIKVDDRDYIVQLDLIGTKDAEVVASSNERCDLCGLAEVGQLLEAQAAVLRRKLEDLIKGPPVLIIETNPAGALVFVDNQLVGTSPLERTMIEGEHRVRVMLDNYVTDEREVNLVSGVRESLELVLKRTPTAAKFRAAGWATLTLGIPVLIGGAVLVALDGREVGECDSSVTLLDGTMKPVCEHLLVTRWGGAAAITGGAALIAVGAMLLLRTRNRNRGKGKKEARIIPTGLGVMGRF